MTKKEILVGSHISSAGQLHLAFQRGELIDCSVMQIFIKSSRTWNASDLDEKEIELFKSASKKSSIKTVVVHAGYLINIASPKTDVAKKSVSSLISELKRCEELEIPYLVLHPGSHLKSGIESGIEQIISNLETALGSIPGKTMILIENMAGQGTNLGYEFEQLKQIFDGCKSEFKKRLGVCFDTCHAFAAGYDISTPESYKKTISLLDKVIGLEHVKAIHLNDSYGAIGSKIDRHAPLGQGKIPIETFGWIMNDKKLWDIPKILETPSDSDMKLWAKEIKLLRNMIKI